MSRDGGQMWDEMKARAEAAEAANRNADLVIKDWSERAKAAEAKLNEVRMERDEERGCVSVLEGIEEELRAKLAEVEGKAQDFFKFAWADHMKHKALRAGVEAEVERLRTDKAFWWATGAQEAIADRLSALLGGVGVGAEGGKRLRRGPRGVRGTGGQRRFEHRGAEGGGAVKLGGANLSRQAEHRASGREVNDHVAVRVVANFPYVSTLGKRAIHIMDTPLRGRVGVRHPNPIFSVHATHFTPGRLRVPALRHKLHKLKHEICRLSKDCLTRFSARKGKA